MKTWLSLVATGFAVLAVILLTVMLIAEMDPDSASLFGMYPF